jgi:hypothetical protein
MNQKETTAFPAGTASIAHYDNNSRLWKTERSSK